MAEQDQDRSEDATPHKLQKARERGQVAKSMDVVSAIVFAAAMVFVSWHGWRLLVAQFRYDQALLIQASLSDPSGAMLWPLVVDMLKSTATLAAPFLLTLLIAAILGNLFQTGPNLAFAVLKIDFQRLNPVNGFKRIFSLRTLFDTARACLKLGILITVAYFVLKSMLPQFYHLASLSPLGFLHTLLEDSTSMGLKMALALGAVALLDWLYTRREFAKKMRMSRRELKDEIKNREGDPRIRSRLRELRREMLRRSQSVRRTAEADVLLTNPTHVAVALRYVHGEMESPQLIAKGAGRVAAAMRKIAAQHRIPVVQNPPLARKLFHELEVDRHVPPGLYAEVARIIVWVFAMRDRQKLRIAGVPA